MYTEMSDFDLIDAISCGDDKAFDALILRYQAKVKRIVAVMIKDQASVPDIVQEVFLKIYRHLRDFQKQSSFYTWMYRITLNSVKNYQKSRIKFCSYSNIDEKDFERWTGKYRLRDYENPESMLSCNEMETAMVFTLNKLPEELRLPILLYEMNGLSYHDIAKEMACPIGTVRSRIARARNVLDQSLVSFYSS